jgi:hypothetical protein
VVLSWWQRTVGEYALIFPHIFSRIFDAGPIVP